MYMYTVPTRTGLKLRLLQTVCVSDCLYLRVEGLSVAAGSVIITDVTYSTEIRCVREEEEGEGEGEFVRLQGVIKEKQRELKHLEFKDAALDQEKDLLNKFASHVTEVSKKEVSVLDHVSQSYMHFGSV